MISWKMIKMSNLLEGRFGLARGAGPESMHVHIMAFLVPCCEDRGLLDPDSNLSYTKLEIPV